MQVHRNIEQLPVFRKAVVTIGTFDGVHSGHRQIFQQLKQEAARIGGQTVIITFHPHPRKIVGVGKSPIFLINTIDEKVALLEKEGIDHVVIVPFTEAFSQMDGRQYVEDFLVNKFHPHTVIIGYDHHFGKERSGNYKLLEEYSVAGAFELKEIPEHVLHQSTVSSTAIRQAVLAGKIEEANELLGYDFFFEGTVVHGNKLGRELGYPTANLKIENEEKLVPGNGIYIVTASIVESDHQHDMQTGSSMKGMMSIGVRPTIGKSERTIEVNLFEFNGDIYGKSLRVEVKKFLRPELKFDGLEALKLALDQDRNNTLSYFSNDGPGARI